jgi:hypothetical protein
LGDGSFTFSGVPGQSTDAIDGRALGFAPTTATVSVGSSFGPAMVDVVLP